VQKRPDAAYYYNLKAQGGLANLKTDTYGEPKIFNFPNGIARVYSPILTDDERKRRMELIAKCAERLLTSKNN
jgi:hypothetical protein